jgi:hypothetical protein
MPAEKRDLLIHYNEETEEIEFFSTDVKNTEAIRKKEFDGVRLKIAELKQQPPDDAEQVIGKVVLTLVELNSDVLFGIRDYKIAAAQTRREYREELERHAARGDIVATYGLAIELHSLTLEAGSLSDLDRVQSLFEVAARGGHQDAAKTVANWAHLREAARRHIERRQD